MALAHCAGADRAGLQGRTVPGGMASAERAPDSSGFVVPSGAGRAGANRLGATDVPASALRSPSPLPCQPPGERYPQRRDRQQRTPDSPRQCPRVGTGYFTIPLVAGIPLRKEFQKLDLAFTYSVFPRCAFHIYPHKSLLLFLSQ